MRTHIEFLDDFVMVMFQFGHFAANPAEFILEGMDPVVGVEEVVVLLLQPVIKVCVYNGFCQNMDLNS